MTFSICALSCSTKGIFSIGLVEIHRVTMCHLLPCCLKGEKMSFLYTEAGKDLVSVLKPLPRAPLCEQLRFCVPKSPPTGVMGVGTIHGYQNHSQLPRTLLKPFTGAKMVPVNGRTVPVNGQTVPVNGKINRTTSDQHSTWLHEPHKSLMQNRHGKQ